MDTKLYRKGKPPVAADQTVYTARGGLRMPLDLSKWVAPEKILEWIQEQLRQLNPAKAEAAEFARLESETRPEVIITLLLYSYATNLFGSEEIVHACRGESMQQRICSGQAPFPHELQHFRRKHRTLLEEFLAEVFHRAVREKYVNLERLPPGVEYSIFTRAQDRLDTARHMDNQEE